MRRRLVKWATVAAVLLPMAIGVYWVYLYQEVRYLAVRDQVHVADAIVVLGAAQYNGRPSNVLKARLEHALFLYSKGYARAIITTGSYGPDPNYSEAHVATEYLTKHGVNPENIITEQASVTTHDSIRAASLLVKSKEWKSVIVVSDGFHLFRAREMFADEDVVAYTSPAPTSPIELSTSQRFWYSLREVFLFSAYRLVDL